MSVARVVFPGFHSTVSWQALMYRAVNTFIDDLFAFVIRMPTLHRLSCFRDDVVFIIIMYQRYKYKARRNSTAASDVSNKEKKE